MKINTLNQLLSESKPGASAWMDGRKVAVVYRPGGKVYHYRGDIHEVAVKLELVPEFDAVSEAERIAKDLRATGKAIGAGAVLDTVRWMCGLPSAQAGEFVGRHEIYNLDMREYTL